MKRPAKSALSFFDKPVSFVKKEIKSLFFASNGLRNESVFTNVNRIYYFAIIAIPIHILLIALFGFSNPDLSPVQVLWRKGIFYSHSALLLIFVVSFWIASSLRKKRLRKASLLLQYGLILLFMAGGIALTGIDQLITTNITPYMIVCILTATVFLIRPLIALPIYLVSFIGFYFAVAWNSPSPDVLLSNRANGLALSAIGFAVSVIMWQNQSINEEQKRCIERQKSALEQLAYTDPLTGLSNRRFFNELVEKEIVTSRDKAYDSCIIVIDIDNFKRINDAHGHPFGDAVLRQFAYLLQDELRARDTVSAHGRRGIYHFALQFLSRKRGSHRAAPSVADRES